MFLGVVASTGEASPPVWYPTGFRLDAASYIESLKKNDHFVDEAGGGRPRVCSVAGGNNIPTGLGPSPYGSGNHGVPQLGKDPVLARLHVAAQFA